MTRVFDESSQRYVDDGLELPIHLPRGVELVTRGAVVVNFGHVIKRRPGLRVYEFDLRTKYADVVGYVGRYGVMLGATEHSLYVDRGVPRGRYTTLALPRLGGRWELIATCSRYTLTVVRWRR